MVINPYSRDWRSLRLFAATTLLSEINCSSIQVKKSMATLNLVGAIVWLINGLHSSPDDSSTGRAVACCSLPLRSDFPMMLTDNPAQNALPFHFYGVIYLRHFQLPPNTPYIRFAETRILAPNHFSNLFGCAYEDVGVRLFGSSALRRPRAEGLVPQRKGNTRERVKSATEELAIFAGMHEVNVNPLGMDMGAEEDHNAYLPLGDTVITNASQLLTDIFYQFPSCIIQKLGNTKSISGVEQSHIENYCPLEHSERQKLTVAEMETLDLSGLFYKVQWKQSLSLYRGRRR